MALDEERLAALVGGEANISSRRESEGGIKLRLKDCGLADVAGIEALGPVRSASLRNGVLSVSLESAGEPAASNRNGCQRLARQILEVVGGAENVRALARCVTRLRFDLVDGRKFDDAGAAAIAGVIEVVRLGGQYQFVVGDAVDGVYDELVSGCGLANAAEGAGAAHAAEQGSKGLPLGRAVAAVSASVGPLAALLSAAGTLKGVLALLVCLGLLDRSGGTYGALSLVASAPFTYLSVLLGYSSAKAFGLNRGCGMAIGAVFVSAASLAAEPSAVVGTIFAGTPLEMTWGTTVLGAPLLAPRAGYAFAGVSVILAVWAASRLEAWLNARIPQAVRALVVPMLVLLVTGPLALLVIAPAEGLVSTASASALEALCGASPAGPALLGLVFGAAWSMLVIYGLQGVAVLLILNNLAVLGFDVIYAVAVLGGFVGVSQGLAVICKTKDAELKAAVVPATLSQALGVGEPLLYGVQLRQRFLYLQNVAFSALGGAACGLMGIRAYAFGGFGVFCLPCYADAATGSLSSLSGVLLVLATMMVASFVFTWLTYHDDGCYMGRRRVRTP